MDERGDRVGVEQGADSIHFHISFPRKAYFAQSTRNPSVYFGKDCIDPRCALRRAFVHGMDTRHLCVRCGLVVSCTNLDICTAHVFTRSLY